MRVTTMTPPPKAELKYSQPDANQLQLTGFGHLPEPPEKLTLTLWLETGLIMEFIQKVVKPQRGDIVVAVEELMRKAIANHSEK